MFSADTRMECGRVGGSVDQHLEDCLTGDFLYPGCDQFLEEGCEYYGSVSEFSPDDGDKGEAGECEDFCNKIQVSTNAVSYKVLVLLKTMYL